MAEQIVIHSDDLRVWMPKSTGRLREAGRRVVGEVGGAVLGRAAWIVGLGLGLSLILVPTGAGAAGNRSPITIGVICSCTGPLASSTSVGPPAYQAWADWQNAHGGINGHPVNVIVDNDNFNNGTALSQADALITENHVIALVDGSNGDTAWQSLADSHRIPVIGGGSQSTLFYTDPNFFPVGQTLDDYYANYIYGAEKLHEDNVGELYCAESTICQNGVAPLRIAATHFHVKVGYVTSISFAAPSYVAQCLAAKQAGVQLMLVADAVSVVQHVASDCAKQGYFPTYMEDDGAVALSFAHATGMEGHYIGSEPDIPFFVTNTAAARQMNVVLEKYAASDTLNSPDYNEEATQFYLSGILLADAARAGKLGVGGPPTAAELYNGLYSLKGDTLGGMAPPLTFHKGQPTSINCWYWISISTHGRFTTPYGSSPVCAQPVPRPQRSPA